MTRWRPAGLHRFSLRRPEFGETRGLEMSLQDIECTQERGEFFFISTRRQFLLSHARDFASLRRDPGFQLVDMEKCEL
jgi:hypothetical protein